MRLKNLRAGVLSAALMLPFAATAQTPLAGRYNTNSPAKPADTVVQGCPGTDANGNPIVVSCSPAAVVDSNSSSFTVWPIVSPGAMPTGARALGYTCSAATTVTLTDSLGNTFSTTLPGGGFHSFTSELPASFSVPGANSCVFTAER